MEIVNLLWPHRNFFCHGDASLLIYIFHPDLTVILTPTVTVTLTVTLTQTVTPTVTLTETLTPTVTLTPTMTLLTLDNRHKILESTSSFWQ